MTTDTATRLTQDQPTRLERIKANTRDDHQQIDDMVMAMKPFDNRDNYGRFLGLQYCFHAVMKPLYHADDLNALIPGLSDRSRFDSVCADLGDLGLPLPRDPGAIAAPHSGPARLGWLYVCEGSNLGAAFLLKAAVKLGLDDGFGARHLGAHDDGRGKHWRQFVQQLNGLVLNPDDEIVLRQGAHDAFDFFHNLLIMDRKVAA
ncbi:biliverdin-producing heme oxygenase [Thalassospira mesophila]|uniref:Heme oxygenase n=1 Tax=Thalassospira mesophila TaxID=1293891 RepID=A0A1Y2L3T1_9PROT|nr:biliverdin-producing heme oxygenase [Thalassospira mesophila]OSQ40331.1 heme oxygenase [Thalassospira mesophila]